MLAEIAAANAAFEIVKGALSNGKAIYDIAEQANDYFNKKSVVAKAAKKNGNQTELQAFMELQKMKKQEEWIKEYMIYAGDPGMWDAWLEFQKNAKRARQEEKRQAIRQKQSLVQEMKEIAIIIGIGLLAVVTILGVTFLLILK